MGTTMTVEMDLDIADDLRIPATRRQPHGSAANPFQLAIEEAQRRGAAPESRPEPLPFIDIPIVW